MSDTLTQLRELLDTKNRQDLEAQEAMPHCEHSVLKLVPRIISKNGEVFSIQASASHYCRPRDNVGPYTHVEIGAGFGKALEPYESDEVLGYVPIEAAAAAIDENGGIASTRRTRRTS